jgi:hypothetical protein
MFGRNGQADRGQRTGRAIGAHAGIDTDAHLAPGRHFDFAIKRRGLRVASAHRAQHSPLPRPTMTFDGFPGPFRATADRMALW